MYPVQDVTGVKRQFSLEIEEEVILVDSRKEDCDGMIKLKGILKKRRDNMIVSFLKNLSISCIYSVKCVHFIVLNIVFLMLRIMVFSCLLCTFGYSHKHS